MWLIPTISMLTSLHRTAPHRSVKTIGYGCWTTVSGLATESAFQKPEAGRRRTGPPWPVALSMGLRRRRRDTGIPLYDRLKGSRNTGTYPPLDRGAVSDRLALTFPVG